MNRQQSLLVGIAAGAAAAFVGGRLIRTRHAIDFAGRQVLITGGSRGLGLAIARQLAGQGARLCLVARDEAALARARVQLEAAGAADLLTLRCDVRRRDEIRDAMEAVVKAWGGVDVLVNNAGVIQVGPLEHMTHDDFENAMATHFWGPLHMMQECVPHMRRRGFGRIVNISSIGGRVAIPHLAPYCASKFALTGLSDAVRAELAQYGIRVTTVCPGLMRTGSPRNALVKGQHEAEYAWFAVSDAMPGLSVSAERAAHQIVEACRHGDPSLTITMPARLAIWASALAPEALAAGMVAATRVLPGPTGSEGHRAAKSLVPETPWS